MIQFIDPMEQPVNFNHYNFSVLGMYLCWHCFQIRVDGRSFCLQHLQIDMLERQGTPVVAPSLATEIASNENAEHTGCKRYSRSASNLCSTGENVPLTPWKAQEISQ